jgi:hypothetical protein
MSPLFLEFRKALGARITLAAELNAPKSGADIQPPTCESAQGAGDCVRRGMAVIRSRCGWAAGPMLYSPG